MKHCISQTEAYKVYAEVTNIAYPTGAKNLAILTQYTDAKNPEELQTRFNIVLKPGELRDLGLFLIEGAKNG